MISGFITYIEVVLLPLGSWGVFVATLIEQLIAPIPSAFVQLGGGFFLVDTEIFMTALWKVIIFVSIPSAFAVGIGSLVVYYLAYFAGKLLVDKWGKFLQVKWHDIELLQQRFHYSNRDDLILLLLRSLPAVPTVAVDIFCGVVRYHIGRYVVITFVGTFIRATIFGLVGWRVGNLYIKYAEYVASAEKYLLVAVIIAIIMFVVIRARKSKFL